MGRVNIGSAFAGLTGAVDKPQDRIVMLSPADLTPWRNPYTGEAQPFRVDESKLTDLEASVKTHGIINPILARRLDDRIEIVAGERRWRVANRLDLPAVPVVIRTMTDEEAAILLVDTNLTVREEILPTEKAAAYKLRLDALKRQGKRTDLTEGDVSHNSYEEIAKEVGDSARQVQRYVRLNYLVPELQTAVDEGKLPMTAAIELSYVPQEEQQEAVQRVIAGEVITVAAAKEQRVTSASSVKPATKDKPSRGSPLPDDYNVRKQIAGVFHRDLSLFAGLVFDPERFEEMIDTRCKERRGSAEKEFLLFYKQSNCIMVSFRDSCEEYRLKSSDIRDLLLEFPDINCNSLLLLDNVNSNLHGLGNGLSLSPGAQLAIKMLSLEVDRHRTNLKLKKEPPLRGSKEARE